MSAPPDGPVRRPVADRRVTAIRPGRHLELPDTLAAEEPMEIRLGGTGAAPEPVGVTMRTPGHDFELAVGFLVSEGLVQPDDTIGSVRYCEDVDDTEQRFNVVTVRVPRQVDAGARRRTSTISAACGICGTATLDDLVRRCRPPAPGPVVPASVLLSLPAALRGHQRVFERTGGLHAAGLFRADGEVTAVREDVGRHNAVDKLIGAAALAGGLPLSDQLLVVSGRVSFEIVQKAAVAGVAVVVAVSAPTSLAADSADRLGTTLVGFVRDGRANVYTHPSRVAFDR